MFYDVWQCLYRSADNDLKRKIFCLIGICILHNNGCVRELFPMCCFCRMSFKEIAGPLYTKRPGVLLPNLAKSRNCEIGCYSANIALQFDRHIGNAAAEVPVKFQNDWKSLNPNFAASSLHEILQ